MPPKVKVTREEIIAAALELLRQKGMEAVNARAVASVLGCSTQPIFSNYSSMAALQQEIAQLYQKNADLQARSTAYETSLESVFSSKSWKLTAPIRSLMRLFHRGN